MSSVGWEYAIWTNISLAGHIPQGKWQNQVMFVGKSYRDNEQRAK